MRQKIIDLLTEHRALLLVGARLAAGMAFDAVVRVERHLSRKLARAPREHAARVEGIQAQVRRWRSQPAERRRPRCTDRKTWMPLSTRFAPKGSWHRIVMSGLRDILSFDAEKRTVTVEPFVTVGQITRYLMARGYMLAVTLEIEDASIGGLALAAGMTAHSHKVGMLFETVSAWEVVLATGGRVVATATDHEDLFRALPWSHGTLGLLVSLELRVIPIKPFMHLTYIPVRSQVELCQRMRDLSTAKDAPDFLGATVFAKDSAVIRTGDLADPRGAELEKVNPTGRFYKPWFHKHVEGLVERGGDEYLPLSHYLMRHNRSIFLGGGGHDPLRQ